MKTQVGAHTCVVSKAAAGASTLAAHGRAGGKTLGHGWRWPDNHTARRPRRSKAQQGGDGVACVSRLGTLLRVGRCHVTPASPRDRRRIERERKWRESGGRKGAGGGGRRPWQPPATATLAAAPSSLLALGERGRESEERERER